MHAIVWNELFKTLVYLLVVLDGVTESLSLEKENQTSVNMYIVMGETFSLNCTVPLTNTSVPKVTWKYPVASINNIKTRFGQITIVNATIDNRGEYFCGAFEDKVKQKVKYYSHIIVHVDKAVLEIDHIEKENDQTCTTQEQLTNRFIINAYPPSIIYRILKDGIDETELLIQSKKVEFEDRRGRKRYRELVLTSNNLTVTDTADYTIVVSNRYLMKNETFVIQVKSSPNVSLVTDSEKIYDINDTVTLKCVLVTGCPSQNVTWDFSNKNRVHKKTENFRKNSKYETEFFLEISILDSVNVTCKVRNVSDTKLLLVHEVKNGFQIRNSNQRGCPEHYSLTKDCIASKHLFTNLTWYGNNNETLINRTKYLRTAESYVAMLEMVNISVAQSGVYKCIGLKKNAFQEVKTIEINIADTKAPVIKDSKQRQVLYVLKFQELRLNCFAEATPAPNILWYKDDKGLLKNSTNVKIINNVVSCSEVKSTLIIKHIEDNNIGKYMCKATSWNTEKTKIYNLVMKDQNVMWLILTIVSVVIIFLLAIVITVLIKKVRKEKQLKKELKESGLYFFEKGNPKSLNPDLLIDEQAELLPYDQHFEFPRHDLILGEQLGSGAFGVVFKATAHGIVNSKSSATVAVKVAKKTVDNLCMKALVSELKIMVHLGKHVNIVNLLGACTKNIIKRDLIIIVEYCKYGNIRNYLIKHRETFINQLTSNRVSQNRGCRSYSCSSGSSGIESDYFISSNEQYTEETVLPDTEDAFNAFVRKDSAYESEYSFTEESTRPLTSRDLLCWAFQIARGMEYLANKKVLHGDLAARNILLAEDNVVKICDFGLARSVYKNEEYRKKSESPLPVKWLAIECVMDHIFSIQSDVWSFGVVLWEIFSLAKTPYSNISVENIITSLLEGYRLEKPLFADNRLYRIMLKCWELNPSSRPSFTQLQEDLGSLLEENVRNYYVELNDTYVDLNKITGQKNYLEMACAPYYENIVAPKSHDYVNHIVTQFKSQQDAVRLFEKIRNSDAKLNLRSKGLKFNFEVCKIDETDETKSQDGEVTPILTLDGLPIRRESHSDNKQSLSPNILQTSVEESDEVFEHKDNSEKVIENRTVVNPIYLYLNILSNNDLPVKGKTYANIPNVVFYETT